MNEDQIVTTPAPPAPVEEGVFDLGNLVTSSTLENNGVWVQLSKNTRILVARENNDKYRRWISAQANAKRALIEGTDELSQETQRAIVREAYARFILLDVDNLEVPGHGRINPRGGPKNFNLTVSMHLMGIKDFFTRVQGFAQQMDLFREKQEEEIAGN